MEGDATMARPTNLAFGGRAWPDSGLDVLALVLALSLVVVPFGRHPLAHAVTEYGVTRPEPIAGSPILRTVRVGLHPFSTLVDAPTGRVFVFAQAYPYATTVSKVDSLAILDAPTGTMLRAVRVGRNAYFGGATIDSRSGHVLLVTGAVAAPTMATGGGTLRILDGRTGAVVHTVPAGVTPRAVAIDGTRHIFVLDAGPLDQSGDPTGRATVRVFDAATGRAIRTVTVGPVTPDGGVLATDVRTSRVFIAEDGDVRVLDAATGATVARVPTSAIVLGLAVDERAGRVVVGLRFAQARAEAVTILNARTGKALRGAFGAGEVVAVDTALGRVVAANTTTASNGGDIDAQVVDIGSGRVVGSPMISTGAGFLVVSAVYEPGHRAIVVTWEGQSPQGSSVASVLDTRSGRLVRQLGLGVGPPAVAIDAQTRRAFIANGGDGTVSVLDAARL